MPGLAGPERKTDTSERSLTGVSEESETDGSDGDAVPADRKAAVAEAVRRALSEHGYARLTTARIAAESEMSEAGLYYYYDSKEAMIVAFLEETADFLARDLAAAEAEGPEEELRRSLDRLFVRREDEPDRGVNVAVMELLSHAPYDETLREPLLAMETRTLERLAETIADGVERGVFRDVDPRGTAAFLLAAADGSTGFYLALGMADVGDRLREQASLFVDSLLVDERAG